MLFCVISDPIGLDVANSGSLVVFFLISIQNNNCKYDKKKSVAKWKTKLFNFQPFKIYVVALLFLTPNCFGLENVKQIDCWFVCFFPMLLCINISS